MSGDLAPPRDARAFRTPERITYGFGAIDALEPFAERHDASSALVVTDPDVRAADVLEPVRAVLADAGVDVSVFDGVRPEPTLEMPSAAADRLSEAGHDVVVGCGGGSSLDTAKLAAVLARHETPVRELLGMDNVPAPGRPVALVPTTAGTGSEVTHIGVFADPAADGAKRVVYSEHLFAELAAVDPAMTRTLPPSVAAATGMDALTHAIESYVTRKRTHYTDLLARRAIELIGENLRPAVHQGAVNDDARYNMLLAAMLAGQAFVNSGLGAVHALTYPLGIRFGLGHGRANAMLLPHVMRYNLPADRARFAEIGALLQAGDASGDPASAVDAVSALLRDVGLPTTIDQLGGLGDDELAELVEIAFEHSRHNIDRNPRALDREDAVEIYRKAR